VDVIIIKDFLKNSCILIVQVFKFNLIILLSRILKFAYFQNNLNFTKFSPQVRRIRFCVCETLLTEAKISVPVIRSPKLDTFRSQFCPIQKSELISLKFILLLLLLLLLSYHFFLCLPRGRLPRGFPISIFSHSSYMLSPS
jgi:hypothetical protein